MIPFSAFWNRFTPTEQQAVWLATVASGTLGIFLVTCLATGYIDTNSSDTTTWMSELVTANAITQARADAIQPH